MDINFIPVKRVVSVFLCCVCVCVLRSILVQESGRGTEGLFVDF